MSEITKELTKRDIQLEYAFDHFVDLHNRIIILKDDIDSDMFAKLSIGMHQLESISKKTITIEINSPGGFAYDALAIIGRIKNSPCKIVTIGYGQIMSAASIILAAGDDRKMSKYAWFMVHEGKDEVRGSVKSIMEYAKQAHKEEIRWAKIMNELTNTPAQIWQDLHQNETYLTAEECLQFGVIDSII